MTGQHDRSASPEAAAPPRDLADVSLMDLMVELAQVRYSRRARARGLLPTDELVKQERALTGELRTRGAASSRLQDPSRIGHAGAV